MGAPKATYVDIQACTRAARQAKQRLTGKVHVRIRIPKPGTVPDTALVYSQRQNQLMQ